MKPLLMLFDAALALPTVAVAANLQLPTGHPDYEIKIGPPTSSSTSNEYSQ